MTLDVADDVVRVCIFDEEVAGDLPLTGFLQDTGLLPGRLAEVRLHDHLGVHVIGAVQNALVPLDIARHIHVLPYDCDRNS